MSNNIFGDDDDDFQLSDGNDVGQPAIQSRPVKATPPAEQRNPAVRRPLPTVDTAVPNTRRSLRNLPEPNQTIPNRNALPTHPNAQNQGGLPTAPNTTRGLPTQPSVKQPVVQQQQEPTYTHPEPVYVTPQPVVQQQEPVYTPPAPVYVEPEPLIHLAAEPYDDVDTDEPVYQTSTPEPLSYRKPEPTPRAVQRPVKREEPELEYAEEEEEETRPVRKKGRSEKTSPVKPAKKPATRTKKATADTEEKPPSRFRGARKSVLIIRIIAGVIIAVFIAAGVKTIFFPVQFPNSNVVTSVVKKNLGITAFPVAAGNQFVLSFTKDYLTIDPATRSQRTDLLKKYTTDSVASKLSSNNNTDKAVQKVIGDPIITSVKSVSDTEAVYTVAVQITADNWLYLAIPVYYDNTINGYTVSGTPAFVVTPPKAGKPVIDAPFTNDSTVATTAQANIQSFFIAWASSNAQDLSLLLTDDATIDAKAGLHGSLKFVKVSDFSVEKKVDGDPTINQRKAQATIVWANPNNPDITYEQTYNLVIFKQPNEKWYVSSVEGGAPDTKASSS